jgi:hypothetical protein
MGSLPRQHDQPGRDVRPNFSHACAELICLFLVPSIIQRIAACRFDEIKSVILCMIKSIHKISASTGYPLCGCSDSPSSGQVSSN